MCKPMLLSAMRLALYAAKVRALPIQFGNIRTFAGHNLVVHDDKTIEPSGIAADW